MKEIIKKIIVGILAVTIVVGAAVYRFVIVPKQRESANTDVTVSDTTEETSKEEETTKKKQDKNNKETTENTESTEASTEVSAEENTDVVTESEPANDVESSTKATTTDSDSQQDATPTTKAPVTETTKPATTKPQATTEEEIIDDTPVDENMIDQYQQLFKSGKFLMKVKDPDLGDVTMAMNGNQMYIDASMEGISLKMIYNGVNKKGKSIEGWSVVIPDMGIYSPMPEEMVGDMNVEELTKDFATGDADVEYTVGTEEINYNGDPEYLVTTETCKDENGNITKYYFDGDVLIRSDSISPSGAVSTTEFSEISADVPDSLFKIEYTKVDISWLLNSLG